LGIWGISNARQRGEEIIYTTFTSEIFFFALCILFDKKLNLPYLNFFRRLF